MFCTNNVSDNVAHSSGRSDVLPATRETLAPWCSLAPSPLLWDPVEGRPPGEVLSPGSSWGPCLGYYGSLNHKPPSGPAV